MDFAVDPRTENGLVHDVVRILEDTKRRIGSIKAQIPINMAPLPHHNLEDSEKDDLSIMTEETWFTETYTRGFGSFRQPEMRGATFDAWMAALLQEICRRK